MGTVERAYDYLNSQAPATIKYLPILEPIEWGFEQGSIAEFLVKSYITGLKRRHDYKLAGRQAPFEKQDIVPLYDICEVIHGLKMQGNTAYGWNEQKLADLISSSAQACRIFNVYFSMQYKVAGESLRNINIEATHRPRFLTSVSHGTATSNSSSAHTDSLYSDSAGHKFSSTPKIGLVFSNGSQSKEPDVARNIWLQQASLAHSLAGSYEKILHSLFNIIAQREMSPSVAM